MLRKHFSRRPDTLILNRHPRFASDNNSSNPPILVMLQFFKMGVLENFVKLQENSRARDTFLINLQSALNFNKETSPQVFSCEFCKISRKPFFAKHLQTIASVLQYCVDFIFTQDRKLESIIKKIFSEQ